MLVGAACGRRGRAGVGAPARGARGPRRLGVVALLLVALAGRPALGTTERLLRLGLLGYLAYSYLIYVTGVPMNRMFLPMWASWRCPVRGLPEG